jgi:lysophospholipase L1-like esterase
MVSVIRGRPLVAGLVLLAAGLVVAGLAIDPAAADPIVPLPPHCEVSADLIPDASPLPHSQHMLKVEHRLKIVALGSSSTLGLGATDSQAAWPARLQAVLGSELPGAEVRVVNRGIARQSAQQMLERLDSDVLGEKPALVIWESGTAEAVRGADVDEYIDALMSGVDRLEAAGVDVILMDTQYSRGTAEIINFDPYIAAIDQVAVTRGLSRFPRYAVMRYWVDNDQFHFAGEPGGVARKMADQVYDCLGHLLARAIVQGIAAEQR